MPALAGITSLIDPATRRRNDVTRITGVEVYGKKVGVVDYSVLDNPPGLTAINTLIGKIPGTRIDNIRVMRVYRQRLHMHQARGTGRRQWRPGLTGVSRTKDPVEGPGNQNIR